MTHLLSILVQTPAHSPVAGPLTYESELLLPPGSLVRVPFGKRETLGVVWDTQADADAPEMDPGKLRAVAGALEGITPLSATWRQLVGFAADYYQRSLGEVALAALPPQLRDLTPKQMERRIKRHAKAGASDLQESSDTINSVALSAEQTGAIAQFDTQKGPFLLFGTTGSGKTEVYLHAVQTLLARDPDAQAMLMVPEINLTPQLEARVRARFATLYGEDAVVSLHSGMTNPQRLKSWLAAHNGTARIVLGTRMAVFASMPHLQLIVIDEEHDPSYKQQEGARYSARDLAIYRGRLEGAKVMLGSAYTVAGDLAPQPSGCGRWPLRAAGDAEPYWGEQRTARYRRGTTFRAACGHEQPAQEGGVLHAAARSHPRACGPRRTKHGVPEPPRLCARAGMQRLRLEKSVPTLQRISGVSQDRPHAALPSLRLYRARAARLP